ncbi:unnamed protein product [Didymodactylos carnosus]|uniref:Uncharacterized protein n=1 Tax=Didymodactylos carnosus TaxID=1234261 RepID=A0A815HUD9_9BILA|nr:unnamed protein product [Didymodactylos carnosus]CAF4231960.1 unnamed protein product [Didymodactylos carnosus]
MLDRAICIKNRSGNECTHNGLLNAEAENVLNSTLQECHDIHEMDVEQPDRTEVKENTSVVLISRSTTNLRHENSDDLQNAEQTYEDRTVDQQDLRYKLVDFVHEMNFIEEVRIAREVRRAHGDNTENTLNLDGISG